MSKAKDEAPEESSDPPASSIWREAVNLVVAVAAGAALVFGLTHDCRLPPAAPETGRVVEVRKGIGASLDVCGKPAADGRPVIVSMLYSDPTRPWVEYAAGRFARLCPDIQIKLEVMDDIKAADAILAGEEKPTIWAPADDLVVRYLESRWNPRSPVKLFEPGAAQSLAQSPLVILVWSDRLAVIEAILRARGDGEGVWPQIACPGVPRSPDLSKVALPDMVPGTWGDWYAPAAAAPKKEAKPKPKIERAQYEPPFPTPEEIRSWGRVKLAHTPPTRAASGLEALYLMAYDYAVPPRGRAAAEKGSGAEGAQAFSRALAQQKDSLKRWLRRCEAGLDAMPNSSRDLTDAIFDLGPSRYDAVVTYEHLTLSILTRIDKNADALRTMKVIYPRPTFANNHPAVILWPDDPASADQRRAAATWLAFLRSQEMQQKAIEYGFRPSVEEVSIRGYTVDENPFLRLRRYGVTFEERLGPPPSLEGSDVEALVRMWEDATGRN